MIAIQCPSCSFGFDVEEKYAGRSGKCKRCGESIKVPSANAGMDFDEAPTSRPQVIYVKHEKGAGTTGNVLAAIMSFIVPGSGQLVQGRALIGIIMFILAVVLWFIFMGWVIHVWSIVDAAIWKPND